ncbi:MAG: glycoside hydrolase family 68 protein [Actinomyces urogenitalis]|uniref:glycoside hydrolase family 68 protein n=1 Tax=Actinomyces urogenitalis TaxID=103621 RepID=UPI00242D0858|nr:glycoside hydrolase family 68 protein [Actinomyces urogenitalis]MCI7456569.1 glycoside hydrolase family 68 protein [Actinomyces urogenitalis]MDY3678529.1 glycoside hydrolase family 68 protein [Actinomyces urogenitalis]
MAFSLADHWMWDHWIARRADQYHLFFLRASKALHNPDRRHWRASIGHAVSSDARNWTLLPDALVHSDGPAFDDQATWTGSAVVKDDGTIRLFYTGISRREGGMVQRVGWADSQDGVTFTRACAEPVEADGRWYEKWNPSYPWDEPWRDPYVFQHEGRWHMLVTARRAGVDRLHAGVIGHAVSDDLDHWEVLEPLTEPSQFGQLEVSQSRFVDGKHLLVFSCGRDMQAAACDGTVWVAEGEGPLGPWDVDNARYVEPTYLYAGQVFDMADGQWAFTGFDDGEDGVFRGVIPDPLPWNEVQLSQAPVR